ncbi:MAG: BatD family protein [Kiritimatiellae bacterium]|nr:BatD family protein [Kiritimatiellia bacterium]MDW8459135.1 BatD family protein [Verrucomicrobiota bacterium]
MRGIFCSLLCAFAIAGLPARAGAFEVELEVSPSVLRVGESAMCRFVIRGAQGAPPPQLPSLDGLSMEPAGTEQNISIVNGQQSLSIAYRYHLIPQKAGDYQIGPFEYSFQGRNQQVAPVRIKVLPAESPGGQNPASSLDEWMFATLEVDREKVYVQQVFDLTLSVFTLPGINLDRYLSLLNFDPPGLSIGGFEEIAGDRTVVDGRVYDVRRFRARVTALAPGVIELQPKVRVNVFVRRERPRLQDPFFGDSFFDVFSPRVDVRAHTLPTRPLRLQIHELPTEGRPSNFSGAVGQYSFDVTVSPTRVRVGEPITIRYRIQGSGNMDGIRAPALQADHDFRAFDAQLTEQNRNEGVLVFEQAVIPRRPGLPEIPALSFSFFNPLSERYETLVRGPIPIAVESDPATPALAMRPRSDQTDWETIRGTDLVYLKPAPKIWRPRSNNSGVPPFLHVLPAIGLLAGALFARRRERLERDPLASARRRAPRRARAGLDRARKSLDDPRSAAASLSRALADYFGPLLGIEPGQISAISVCSRLRAGGMPDALCKELEALFSLCERLQFAGPAAAAGDSDREALARAIERAPDLLRASRRYAR